MEAKRLIPRNLLGLKEFRFYFTRLGDPLKIFKLKKSVVKLEWVLSSLFYQIPTFISKMKKKNRNYLKIKENSQKLLQQITNVQEFNSHHCPYY